MYNKHHIFIVEDNADFANIVKVRLESAGYEVSVARDTYFDFGQLRRMKCDLLLFDAMMWPSGKWHPLIKNIRGNAFKAEIPVVILSGKISDNKIGMESQAHQVYKRIHQVVRDY